MSRNRTAEIQPPKCPITIPIEVPITIDINVARNPISSDTRAPQSTCSATDRPESSVPNRNLALGLASTGLLIVLVTSSWL